MNENSNSEGLNNSDDSDDLNGLNNPSRLHDTGRLNEDEKRAVDLKKPDMEEVKENIDSGENHGYVVPDSGATADTAGDNKVYSGYLNESSAKSSAGESKILEICALVFGILSIVGCCFYGVVGVIGVIISIVALAKGKKTGMTIAGFVLSIIGLLLGIGFAIFFMFGYSVENAKKGEDTQSDGYVSSTEKKVENTNPGAELVGELEKYLDASADGAESENEISDAEIGTINIQGKTYTIPCQFSDFLDVYEVSKYSQEDMETALKPEDSTIIYFAENGQDNGISVNVENLTDETLTDISKASVYSVNIMSDNSNVVDDVSAYGGISLGMSLADLEVVLADVNYETSEISDYKFYRFDGGEEQQYEISVMLDENHEVISIDLYYNNY